MGLSTRASIRRWSMSRTSGPRRPSRPSRYSRDRRTMDTRTLIAFGMLLAVLTVALIKGSLDGAAAKEVLQNIASGLIGGAVGFRVAQSQSKPPSTGQTPPKGTPTLPIALLLVGAALLLSGCATS